MCRERLAILGLFAVVFAYPGLSIAGAPREIALPGDYAYPESIAAAGDGTLYVSSIASGGVWRIKPQTAAVEQWVKPGKFDTRSILGVLVDDKANLLGSACRSQGVGILQRPRRCHLGDLAGRAVLHLHAKKGPIGEVIDVEMAVFAERDAVQTGGTFRRLLEGGIVEPDF